MKAIDSFKGTNRDFKKHIEEIKGRQPVRKRRWRQQIKVGAGL